MLMRKWKPGYTVYSLFLEGLNGGGGGGVHLSVVG